MVSKSKGFMTTELMVVAVVLTILSSISASAIPAFAQRAKKAALASTLCVLQGASDRFFIESNTFPCADEPEIGNTASALNPGAADAEDGKFVGSYIHNAPNAKAVDYGLDSEQGGVVFFGVTASGRVFGTQTTPEDGVWEDGNIAIFTQEDVSGSLVLSSVW